MISDFFPSLLEDAEVLYRKSQQLCGKKPKQIDTDQRVAIAVLHLFATAGMIYSGCFLGNILFSLIAFPTKIASIALLALFSRDLFVLTQNSAKEKIDLFDIRSLEKKQAKKLTNNTAMQPLFLWAYKKNDPIIKK